MSEAETGAAPAPESEPSMFDVLRQQQAAEPPPEETRGQREAREIDEAVAEMERRQQAERVPDQLVDDLAAGVRQNPDNFRDPDVERPTWIDGRDPNTPITADQAARAYTQYKAQKALEVLQAIDQQQSQPAEAEPEEQPSEPAAEEKQQPDPAQWSEEDWRTYAASLPPEQRLHITKAVEHEQERQASAQVRAQFQQAAQTHEFALHAAALNAIGAAQSAFSDIRTEADLIALQRNDPQRAQIYAQYANQVAQLKGEAEGIRSQMQRAAQAQAYENQLLGAKQFEEWSKHQDEAATAAIPELSDGYDRAASRDFQNSTLKMLKDAGYSEAEVRQAWNGAPLHLRDARAQRVLADATRWRASQARQQSLQKDIAAHKRPAPKVQRPGIAQSESASSSQLSRIKSLEKQLESARGNAALRIGTELYEARQALQR